MLGTETRTIRAAVDQCRCTADYGRHLEDNLRRIDLLNLVHDADTRNLKDP